MRLGANTPEPQRKFGFTFWSDRTSYHRVVQEEAKFALAPDSLVREALLAWIDEQTKQGLVRVEYSPNCTCVLTPDE